LKSSTPLQTRVGIATGLVVVGDLIGSGAAQEQTVVGETPNLARALGTMALLCQHQQAGGSSCLVQPNADADRQARR